jgi:multidrug efflux pump subunit AcrB
MIPGIANMTSLSQTGEASIVLQFDLNRSIDAAAQDVQAAIARAAGALLASMPSPPSYSKVNPASDPILWLEMSSTTMALGDFAKYADQVFAKRIAMVSGVSQVPVWGPSQTAIRVQADPAKLAAYGLDLERIRAALTTNSANLPSGTLYGDARDYSLQANSQLTTAAEFSQLIVAYRGGVPLRLNQVADVFNSSRDDKSTFWINGRPSVILAVRKQPGADTVEVADHVKEVIRSLRPSMPPGVSFGKIADSAMMVRDSIAEVDPTLVLTVLLVVLVIFVFLGTASSTLIASATIPVSILGSFIAMRLLGYSVDLFSMMGVTLSVGFVVDDAIVMIENIVRHRRMGKSKMQAALDGASEVGFTIISMTVSLVAVFLPILFLNGGLGRLLREFAVTISVSFLLSGLTALTLTPILCSRLLSSREHAPNWFQRRTERMYAAMERAYRRSLEVVLRHRRATLGVSVAMTTLTIILFLEMPKSIMPPVDVGYFSGTLEAAQNNSFTRMIAYGEQVNAILAKMPWMESNLSGVESQNNGWFHVNLIEDRHRPDVQVIMADLQKKLNRIPGLNVYLRQGDFLSLGQNESRSQYSAALEGPDPEELYRWAPQLKAKLQSLPELAKVSNDLELNAPRINVGIRRSGHVAWRGSREHCQYSLRRLRQSPRQHHHSRLAAVRRNPRSPEAGSARSGSPGKSLPELEHGQACSIVRRHAPLTNSCAAQREPCRAVPCRDIPIRSEAPRLPRFRDTTDSACRGGDRNAGTDLRLSGNGGSVPEFSQRSGSSSCDRGTGDLSGSRRAVRKLHPSPDHSLGFAIGRDLRPVDVAAFWPGSQPLLVSRRALVDWNRQEECNHDRRLRPSG